MPVYEFRCRDCKKRFEVTRPITKVPKSATCPKCGSKKVERAYSSVFLETSKKS